MEITNIILFQGGVLISWRKYFLLVNKYWGEVIPGNNLLYWGVLFFRGKFVNGYTGKNKHNASESKRSKKNKK